MSDQPHLPVLLREVTEHIKAGSRLLVDGTFGAGGHSRTLMHIHHDAHLIALDRDPNAQKYADGLAQEFGQAPDGRFTFLRSNFGDMRRALPQDVIGKVDAVLLDLGVSTMQLREAERGFSFMRSGPLDMRMGQDGMSAADLLAITSQEGLEEILRKYGDEPRAGRIARAIVERQAERPFEDTLDLASVIARASGYRNGRTHPATRSFQALRIAVNDEYGELERFLPHIYEILAPGGRAMIITFHSGEDRIVKHFFKEISVKKQSRIYRGIEARDERVMDEAAHIKFAYVTNKPLQAREDELRKNPLSRSAKLRVMEKIYD